MNLTFRKFTCSPDPSYCPNTCVAWKVTFIGYFSQHQMFITCSSVQKDFIIVALLILSRVSTSFKDNKKFPRLGYVHCSPRLTNEEPSKYPD